MNKILIVLGCCGLMVVSASAGERWSAESCKHLQEMKADAYAGDKEFLVWKLVPILRFQRDKCGVNIDAEYSAAKRAFVSRGGGSSAPRQPVLCDTTSKAYGGSYTDCF